MKIKKVILAIILLAGFNFSAGEKQTDNWYDFNSGLNRAGQEGKPVLIDFYTDWCHWCEVMDEKTFSEKTVKQYLDENFIKIRVNAEDKNSTHKFQGNTFNSVELTKAFKVSGYPSIAFLNDNKEVITVIPGYIPAEKFIKILEYIDQECYAKDVSFEEYLNNGCEKEG